MGDKAYLTCGVRSEALEGGEHTEIAPVFGNHSCSTLCQVLSATITYAYKKDEERSALALIMFEVSFQFVLYLCVPFAAGI